MPSRFGPAGTSIVSERNVAPNRAAAAATTVGLVVGSGPQTVVDVNHRHDATGGDGQHHQRHRVGAPGDGAGDLGAGQRERASGQQVQRGRLDTCADFGVSQRARRSGRAIGCGLRISSIEGRFAAFSQQTSTARGPRSASIAAMNRSPAAYWLSLPSIPVSRSISFVRGLIRFRRACMTAENRPADGTRSPAARAHGDVTVTFEQGHQSGDLLDDGALLGRGDQSEHTAVADLLTGSITVVERLADRLGDAMGIRVGHAHADVDQIGEMRLSSTAPP